MLKYCWIIMLAVIWIIWLITTVVDVINTYRRIGFSFKLFTCLKDSSKECIGVTVIIIFEVSFISWALSFINK